MKRLNPLYLIALFFTITFISFFLLNSKKEQYKVDFLEYENLKEISKEYKNLTQQYKNEKYVNETLDLILKNKLFSNQKILRTKTNDVIKLRIESNDGNILDSFLNKILNKPLIIKKLQLEKNYINLEIGVK